MTITPSAADYTALQKWQTEYEEETKLTASHFEKMAFLDGLKAARAAPPAQVQESDEPLSKHEEFSMQSLAEKFGFAPPAKVQEHLTTPNTYGGFQASFYVEHKRNPSQQEVFDAGVRSGQQLDAAPLNGCQCCNNTGLDPANPMQSCPKCEGAIAAAPQLGEQND